MHSCIIEVPELECEMVTKWGENNLKEKSLGDHNNQVHKLQTSIKSQIEKNGMACNNGHSISCHSKEEKF